MPACLVSWCLGHWTQGLSWWCKWATSKWATSLPQIVFLCTIFFIQSSVDDHTDSMSWLLWLVKAKYISFICCLWCLWLHTQKWHSWNMIFFFGVCVSVISMLPIVVALIYILVNYVYPPQHLFSQKNLLYVCVSAWIYVHRIHAGGLRGHKKLLDPVELEL